MLANVQTQHGFR